MAADSKTYLQVAVALLVMGAAFAADLLAPPGVVPWIVYVGAVAAALFTWRPLAPVWAAVLCSVLLVLGQVLTPTHDDVWMSWTNRATAVALVAGLAWMGWHFIHNRRDLRLQDWLRSGQSELALRLQGEQPVHALGDQVLQFLAARVGAHAGALYVTEADGTLRRRAGYALANADVEAGERFALGEGLVGQAAVEKRLMLLRDVPGEYLKVTSGLGSLPPLQLVLVPTAADGAVEGVVELAFLHPVDDAGLELLKRVSEPIAVALRSWSYRMRLEQLLEETQRQARELQEQQEELRTTNEELEQQTERLLDSQRRLEQQQVELEETNAQLEGHTQLLEDQKAAVAQARDAVAAKAQELAQISQYKSEFLANMSHELRTPLNSLLILAKLLADNKQGNLLEEQVKFAQTIYSSGNDLLALINDILDLSKVEAGKLDVVVEPMELSELFDDMERTFRPVARQKGLAFRVEVDESAPTSIRGDAKQARQVLKNLLSNAFKFTKTGEVALRAFRAPDQQVAFAVHDTGIGIPAHKQEAIFEAFQQADGTVSRTYGGTGLGLSISRKLAELLGGSISVESEPGRGSTFCLCLPVDAVASRQLEREDVQAQEAVASGAVQGDASRASLQAQNGELVSKPTAVGATPAKPVEPAAEPTAEMAVTSRAAPPPARIAPGSAQIDDDRQILVPGSRRLLVVEDDLSFARILYDLAHEHGYQCIVATTADEGVALAVELQPDAVVLDVRLPDHSGLSVLDRLKHTAAIRHIPVHVVSVADHTQAALAMGAIGYLLKPVERERLAHALRHLDARLTRTLRRVLVVEDDAAQREAICKLLTGDEVETVAVGTAQEANAQVVAERFDCIVLDLGLPDMSGFDLLEQLTKALPGSLPPVIIYTARMLTEDEEQRLRRYSSSIILKSVRSPERLLDEVTLFLHQVESKLPPDRQRMLREVRSREAAFEGRRILVAEDDIRNVFALSSILEPRGARLEIARNGKEALDALERIDIDLVLMDVMMPEVDGLQAMRAIRSRPELNKLPVIALTAKAMPDDQAKCLEAGANDYIAKPIDVDKLLSLMRVWMPR